VGNNPFALPGPTMESLCPVVVSCGNDPVNPTDPTEPVAPTGPLAPFAPTEPLAPLEPEDPDDPDEGTCAVGEPCGDEDDWEGDGEPRDGLVADADGDGDFPGCGGVATMTLPAALGGVQGRRVGTLAVADSVTEVPAAPAGTCACIW
jgi:hypothetical protein